MVDFDRNANNVGMLLAGDSRIWAKEVLHRKDLLWAVYSLR